MQVTEEFLEAAFSHIGTILDVIVKRHLICTDPPQISGYAFVFFEDMPTAVRAISTMKGVTVDSVHFDCQFGTPKREDRKHQHHGPSFGVVSPQVLQQIQQQQQQQGHHHSGRSPSHMQSHGGAAPSTPQFAPQPQHFAQLALHQPPQHLQLQLSADGYQAQMGHFAAMQATGAPRGFASGPGGAAAGAQAHLVQPMAHRFHAQSGAQPSGAGRHGIQPLQQALLNAHLSGAVYPSPGQDARGAAALLVGQAPPGFRAASSPSHQQQHQPLHLQPQGGREFAMEKEFAQLSLAQPAGGFRQSLHPEHRRPSLEPFALPTPPLSAPRSRNMSMDSEAAQHTTNASTPTSASMLSERHMVIAASRSEDWLSEAMSPSPLDARLPPSSLLRAPMTSSASFDVEGKPSLLSWTSSSDDTATTLAARGLLATATMSRDELHVDLSSISSSSLLAGQQSQPSTGRFSGGLHTPSVCTTVDHSLMSSLSYGSSRSFSSSYDVFHAPIAHSASSGTPAKGGLARAVLVSATIDEAEALQRDRALFALTPSPEPWLKDGFALGLGMSESNDDCGPDDAEDAAAAGEALPPGLLPSIAAASFPNLNVLKDDARVAAAATVASTATTGTAAADVATATEEA